MVVSVRVGVSRVSIFKLCLNLSLPERWNPKWADPHFRNWFCRDWKIAPTKSFEFEITHTTWHELFFFDLDIQFSGQDHAGPRFRLGLLGWEVHMMIYDHRHWNWDEKRWCRPGDGYDREERLIPLSQTPESI